MMSILLQLILCVALILLSGMTVAKNGDVIAEKTGLGRVWVGFVLIAVLTSLPETFTGVASSLMGNPELSVGNLFGANAYNLANLALMALVFVKGSLFRLVSKGHSLSALLSLLPLGVASLAIATGRGGNTPLFLGVSIYSWAILAAYLVCSAAMYQYERKTALDQTIEDQTEKAFKYNDFPLSTAVARFALGALFLCAGGVWLSSLGNTVSEMFGLGKGFVGSLLFGFATTLPELTVSVAALRLGAPDMALANVLGSNMFNMVIIFINDIFYREGNVIAQASPANLVMSFTIAAMTGIVLLGLMRKPDGKAGRVYYPLSMLVVFVVGMLVNYLLSRT